MGLRAEYRVASVITALAIAIAIASPAAGDEDCVPTSADQIFASDGAEQHQFGGDVSIDGDRALIGARRDRHQGDWTGSAFLFERTGAGNQWTEVIKLIASDPDAGDQFGTSVSLSGDIAMVGSPHDDDLGQSAGAVFVYAPNTSGVWVEVQKLFASDAEEGEWLGTSVSLDGDTAVIGAPGNDGGQAYVFRRDRNGVWQEIAILSPADPVGVLDFGFFVCILGDTIVVSSPSAGDGLFSGTAHVFRETSPGQWDELASWSGAGFFDTFGASIAMNENTIAIANLGVTSGQMVHVFHEQSPGRWQELPPLADIGHHVSIDGDTMIVGDIHVARIFRQDAPETWTYVSTLAPFDGAGAFEVDVSGFYAVLGTIEHHLQGTQAGTAYLYDIHCEQPCEYDLNNDGGIGPEDLAIVLKAWGPCDGCAEDANADAFVNPADIAEILGNWGPCP